MIPIFNAKAKAKKNRHPKHGVSIQPFLHSHGCDGRTASLRLDRKHTAASSRALRLKAFEMG